MDFFISFLGLWGAVLAVSTYWALECEKISSTSPTYYALNGVSAVLVIAAILYEFDIGDLGGIVQEACWAAISVMGVVKYVKGREQSKAEQVE